MAGDEHHVPRNTREFLALWNDAVEEHLVHQLAQSVPGLVRGRPMDPASAEVLARHLVRALRVTSMTGDPAAAVRHLEEAARAGDQAPDDPVREPS